MEKITNPAVKTLASGATLMAKQMQSNEGELMPAHLADVESILLVQEGECIFYMKGEERVLKPGDVIIVPADTKHQIRATKKLKAVHFMPKDINFKFYK